MQVTLRTVDGFTLESTTRGHTVTMDSAPPIGRDKGPTPKELLMHAVMGCTAMDVVGLLRKSKIPTASLSIIGTAEQSEHHPRVFKGIALSFDLKADDTSSAAFKDAITQSLTKYCGVSAMVFKVVPISWNASVNGKEIGSGIAEFAI